MRLKFVTLFLVSLAILAEPAHAGLVITATGGTVNVGSGTLNIPVLVTSDSSDNIGTFTVVFDITPVGEAAPGLSFVSPASSATDPTLNDTNYVYNSGNPNLQTPFPPASAAFDSGNVFGVGTVTSSPGYDTHFVGSDSYDGLDPNGYVTLVSGTNYVLANLVVQFIPPGTTNPAGDVFNITLDTQASKFFDATNDPLRTNPNYDTNGSNPILAVVNVSPADVTAVPEPSTMLLSLSGMFSGGLLWLRRRLSASR